MYNPSKIDLLLVLDETDFRSSVAKRVARLGFRVQEGSNQDEALALAERRQFDVAVVGVAMPGASGVQLLEKLKTSHLDCEIILLAGEGGSETAAQAMKSGACDYLTRPFPLEELELRIEKAYERRQLRKENGRLKTLLNRSQAKPEIIGASPAMQQVFQSIERAGPTDSAVLIQGESGSGKEFVAKALHRASPRADKPLVTINCAALPETQLESELFGHEKGSFAGAVAAKPGLFELADGGTLLIDEIEQLTGSLQAKLFHALEDGSMRRVGSVQERRVDVRLLVATNRNLEQQVAEGRFREDLYCRINVMSLELPPLRERQGDVPLLVQHFLESDWQIDAAALEALEACRWPGNVRQLLHAVERGKILSDDKTLRLADLPVDVAARRRNSGARARQPVVGQELASVERAHIVEILQREKGNKVRTARALGVNRRSLYRLLDKYDIRAVAEAISAGAEQSGAELGATREQAEPFAHCE